MLDSKHWLTHYMFLLLLARLATVLLLKMKHSLITNIPGDGIVILHSIRSVIVRLLGVALPIVIVRYHSAIRLRLFQLRPEGGIINILMTGVKTTKVEPIQLSIRTIASGDGIRYFKELNNAWM